MAIRKKSRAEIDKMRLAGRVVHETLKRCAEACKPGVTTKEIDEIAPKVFDEFGAKGLFLGYPGATPFPSNLCISVNEVVVHGIASDRKLKDGDIVGIDCGVKLNGWCGDSATTVLVGNVSEENRRLCDVTKRCLELAIENIKPGRKWSQIAGIMQRYAEENGMGVVKNFVGHGIGSEMHESPQLPNYVSRDLLARDIMLSEGMVLAVEPMCNLGTEETEIDPQDQWTVYTKDRKYAAHYEHTIAVTADGSEVLTDGK